MTAALDHARATIDAHRTATATAMGQLQVHVERIDGALVQLSSSGPLGNSDDPNLEASRSRLIRARQALAEAAHHLELSRGALLQLTARLFPP